MLYLCGNFLYTCGYLAGNMQAICIGLVDVTICKISKTCFNDEIASYLSFHPHDILNVVNFAFIRMFRDNTSIIFCFRWVVQKIFIFSKKRNEGENTLFTMY